MKIRACGLTSTAIANQMAERTKDLSAAPIILSSRNTIKKESACPQAAESINTAGLNRYSSIKPIAIPGPSFLRPIR
ncbi:hypothetical protein D3C81_1655560 [compost metagenome]